MENPSCKFFSISEDFMCFLSDVCSVDRSIVGIEESRFFVRTYKIPDRLKGTVYSMDPLWDPSWTVTVSSADEQSQPDNVLRSPHFPEMPQDSVGTSIFNAACFSTKESDTRHWWRADLTKRVIVSAVRITLPKNSIAQWTVLVGEKPEFGSMRTCGTFFGGWDSFRITLECKGMIGRFVAIVETEQQKKPLRLCNVEIFGSFVGN